MVAKVFYAHFECCTVMLLNQTNKSDWEVSVFFSINKGTIVEKTMTLRIEIGKQETNQSNSALTNI